jgi:GTP1/Obg family GTP-binding protein
MAQAIADALEEAAPILVKQVQDAEQRHRERQAQADIERRRRQARERAEARQHARQAAREELRSIVTAWNDAFALEAFFTELLRRATLLAGDDRANLLARIETARELLGGRDAVDRFLRWSLPADHEQGDSDDEPDDDVDDAD